MADASKGRFVRCPNCENVLQELPQYSVYRCGGCGAVLRGRVGCSEAKEHPSSTKLDGEIVEPVRENLDKCCLNFPKTLEIAVNSEAHMNRDGKGETVQIAPDSMSTEQIGNKIHENEIGKQSFPGESPLTKPDEPERAERLHEDTLSLLTKLDDLKELLSQSRGIHPKSEEEFPGYYDSSGVGRSACFRNPGSGSYLADHDHIHPPVVPCHYRGQFPANMYFAGQCLDGYGNPILHESSHPCFHCFAPHDAGVFAPQFCNPRTAALSPPSLQDAHLRSANDFHRFRRCIPPVGSGAPFLTCWRCFELLQIPSKSLSKNERRVMCGACSAVAVLSILNNKLVVIPQDANPNPAAKLNWNSLNFFSDDSVYEFPSANQVSSTTSSLSHNDDDDLDYPSPVKPASSQEQESSNNRHGKGNQSARSDHNTTSRQNSLKDLPPAAENDAKFSTGTSSVVICTDQANKKGDNFFMGMKNTFRGISKLNRTNNHPLITINGHPISERAARKAEKLAGQIHPGHYWYDSRAGFWGVIGKPCLGIIPPFIQEFDFPMRENCAGGDTGVVVNGRELHERDLELLVRRGLPSERGRSYIIEICGSVLDLESGEELESLGKLAPTVEKARRGFGMKAPGERT